MGKRKERRLAAKIGAGRRVKLDLFADPPEEVGGSSAKDEVGKHLDADLDPESPGSPSSGHQVENPLSLLGQYSDDEVDGVSNKKPVELDIDNQAKGSADDQLEEGEFSGNEDLSPHRVDDKSHELGSSTATVLQVTRDDDTTNLVTFDETIDKVSREKQNPVSLVSGTQPSGEMDSNWRMVFDEKSNDYYYWNTVTGETSWEVPENLLQATLLTNEFESSGRGTGERYEGNSNISANYGLGYSSGNPNMKVAHEQLAQQSRSVEQSEVDGDQLQGVSSAVTLPYETSCHYLLPEQYNGGVGSLTMDGYGMHDHSAMSSVHVDFPSLLLKNCEALVERLKILQRSGIDAADVSGWFSKYLSEIEVRLSDIRALLPYGSSLTPFWLHSQRQINQLENAVNEVTGKQGVEPCTGHLSLTELKDTKREGSGKNLKLEEHLTKLSPVTTTGAMLDMDASVVVQKALHENASDGRSLKVPQMSLSNTITESHLGKEGSVEINVLHREEDSMLEVQSGEDVGMDLDMDVDMEVEVPSPTGTRKNDAGDSLLVQSDSSVQPSGLSGPYPSSENEVPVPPEEDWIPPPPPDDEGIPPPPPDEPPESLLAPPLPSKLEAEPKQESVPDSMQCIYGGQYGLTYAQSDVNYYGNPSLVPLGNGFYENLNDTQIAAVDFPVYYAGVSNSQPATVLTQSNIGAYYGIHNAVSPVVPLANSGGSLVSQAVASNLTCDAPLTSEIASVGASMEEHSAEKLVGDSSQIHSSQVSSATAISASAAVFVKEPASISSFSAAATSSTSMNVTAVSDASAAASKMQSKALRMKKPKVSVASSLKSNKKVSSLVDKWKAAKEELHEQEEEDRETPLGFLEKKRQREIDVWRAQQVATEEAKENANFQPLGGDWRERVKRRRAQKEAVPHTSLDAVGNVNGQHDVIALSKDLPIGWQAHWDDSSRRVYYSNSQTSETTWTRPIR